MDISKITINVSGGDRFYIVEHDNILSAEIMEINRVRIEPAGVYVEATCKVYIPGLRSVIRIYTFCLATLNKTLFIGEDASRNAERALVEARAYTENKIREEAKTDALANFSQGINTTPDFHFSVLHNFYNNKEEGLSFK